MPPSDTVASWLKVLFLCVLFVCAPVPVQAQGGVSLQVGGGLASREVLQVDGGHGLLSVDLPISAYVGGKFDGFLAVGDLVGSGRETVLGAAAGLVFRWPRTRLRPYGGAGLSFVHTSLSSEEPASHDLGLMFRVGFEWESWGNRWFVDVSSRLFGNIFRSTGNTHSVNLFTVGVRI